MKSDLKKIIRSKHAFRDKLARKPIAEKLQILEQMVERARWIQKHQKLGRGFQPGLDAPRS